LSRKAFILDTNVLLNDPGAILSFDNSDVIIPLSVLKELDKHKTRTDEIGKNARGINRTLDGYRNGSSLLKGIKLINNGTLFIKTITKASFELLPHELKASSHEVDTGLIALMLELKSQNTKKIHTLITRDINLRVQCDALGIRSENYRIADHRTSMNELYGGVTRASLSKEKLDKFYQKNELELDEIDIEDTVFSNQFLVIKSDLKSGSAIGRYNADSKSIKRVIEKKKVFGLSPRNKEQNFALDLLLDPELKLITLTGPAGTGKTLLTLAAGCQQVIESKLYERLIIIKPVQPVGKDLGFLPGSLDEKLAPWISPIKDNLNFLFQTSSRASTTSNSRQKKDDHYLSLLFEKKVIEVEAIAFIRGRSIPNAYIVIDEAQNLSTHELRTIITRVGEGTKIILTGDIGQIDHPQLDVYSNGLTHAVERFKEYQLAGHITLLKGERSALATLASEIL